METTNRQFKVVAYHTQRDHRLKQNGEVFTDIESLLKRINEARYYNADTCVEVTPDKEWNYRINETFEGLDKRVWCWVIEEEPTDTKIRIVGVDMFLAKPQRCGVYVYEDLNDTNLADVDQGYMYLYPYTMREFIRQLANPPVKHGRCGQTIVDEIPWKDCDFIALLNIN